MAIYPALLIAYLDRIAPWFAEGHRGEYVDLAVIAACVVLNIAGVEVVSTAFFCFFIAVSAPFAIIALLALFKHGVLLHVATASTTSHVTLIGGLLVCMWNYMGWDNASTIATEVENPQRNYPRAMLLCVLIVALSYVIPVAAVWLTGLSASAWETGSWADIAAMLGGPLLQAGLVLGGMISALGMFNALVMSYSRLPLAMAEDKLLPRVFAWRHPRTRAPWVAILVLAAGWAMCLGLGFERLVTLDILIYGLSLALEFAALAILRIREPDLPRRFRVPGAMFGAIGIGIAPMLMLAVSVVRSGSERVWGMSSFVFAVLIIIAGMVAYLGVLAFMPAASVTPKMETR